MTSDEQKVIDWKVRHVEPEECSLIVTIRIVDGEPEIGDVVVCPETKGTFQVTGFAALGYGADAHASGIRILGIRATTRPSGSLEAGHSLRSKNSDQLRER
jgi:hypothetical protein